MPFPHRATYQRLDPSSQCVFALGKVVALSALWVLGAVGVQAGQLSLTWQDNSDNEDGFEVERCLMGESFGVLATVGPDAEAYVDESIVPGLEYEYRVRAFNAFGYSGYTNVSVGALPNTPPQLGAVPNVSALKGEAMPEAAFSFADAESDASELFVEALSSNLSLVPLSGISVSLGEGTGSVSIEPVGSATGSATVTLLLSDGVEISQQTFQVEVLRNLAPTVGTLAAIDVFDSQQVGPIPFTISDSESDAGQLVVVGDSLDESLIASGSISIAGSGANRTVSFATQAGVAGTTTIRLAVSDGVNTTHGGLRVTIAKNALPVISGLEQLYTIESGGSLDALAFEISDQETASSALEVSVRSSNAMLVSQFGLQLKGSANQRTLDATPNPGMTGTAVITISVSDGIHTSEQSFNLRVLAPDQIVKILGFTIEDRLAVVEVENRPNAAFTLWKIHSLDGAWERVADAAVVAGDGSTTLIDPTPVGAPVCYRVVASE